MGSGRLRKVARKVVVGPQRLGDEYKLHAVALAQVGQREQRRTQIRVLLQEVGPLDNQAHALQLLERLVQPVDKGADGFARTAAHVLIRGARVLALQLVDRAREQRARLTARDAV